MLDVELSGQELNTSTSTKGWLPRAGNYYTSCCFLPLPTRLERAREEAARNFQHTALGEGVKKKYPKVTMAKLSAKKVAVAARKEGGGEGVDGGGRYKTKVERSRQAASESFGGVALDKLPVRKKVKM